jgi:XTP/dITP diphosphohydrolase
LKLVFATTNAGKLAELRMLAPPGLEWLSGVDVSLPEVHEDGDTFQANAAQKALSAARSIGFPAVADDSGLCVDALGGRPGVLSARYAPGSDAARVARLLAELEAVPDSQRGAAFRCALCLAMPDGRSFEVEDECRGSIARQPRGGGGFGYDPVFLLPTGETMAELTREAKSRVSHRGRAFARLVPLLLKLSRGEI